MGPLTGHETVLQASGSPGTGPVGWDQGQATKQAAADPRLAAGRGRMAAWILACGTGHTW
jgi:hypothetical protein